MQAGSWLLRLAAEVALVAVVGRDLVRRSWLLRKVANTRMEKQYIGLFVETLTPLSYIIQRLLDASSLGQAMALSTRAVSLPLEEC